jgi:hypothetical protein
MVGSRRNLNGTNILVFLICRNKVDAPSRDYDQKYPKKDGLGPFGMPTKPAHARRLHDLQVLYSEQADTTI